MSETTEHPDYLVAARDRLVEYVRDAKEHEAKRLRKDDPVDEEE